MVKFKVIYNGKIIDTKEMKTKEFDAYKKVLNHNLPKAIIEEIKEETKETKKTKKTNKKITTTKK